MQQDLRRLGTMLWPDDGALRPAPAERAGARRATVLFRSLAVAFIAIVAAGALVLHSESRQSRTGGTGNAPAVAAAPVPWLDAPAANAARPYTIPGVPPCTAAALDIVIRVTDPSYIGGGPINTSFWRVVVRNKSSAACFVGQPLEVRFFTARGALPVPRNPLPASDITYLAPESEPPPPGFSAAADGEIGGWGPCALPPITSMIVSPGAGLGSVVVTPGPAGGSGSPCPGKDSYYSELYPENGGPVWVPLTSTSLRAPGIVHPGQRLRFLVTITDVPAEPRHCFAGHCPTPIPLIPFQPCPRYHEELEGVDGSFHTYRLDCVNAVPLLANGREAFEMYLDVPASARPGPTVLAWAVDGDPAIYGTARAFVSIAG